MPKIGFVCFVGAFVGALIALQVGGALWWIGAIAGALVAYLGYEIKPLALAARKTTALTAVALASGVKNWRLPDKEQWRRFWRRLWLTWSGAALLMFCLVSWAFLLLGLAAGHSGVSWKWADFVGCGATFALGVFIFSVIGMTEGLEGAEFFRQSMKKLLIRGNPLAVTFYLLKACFFVSKVCFYLLRALPWLVIFWTVVFFRLIHSEARLVCALDAALGAAIGYFAGNAAIGGLAGGILGLGHFWLARRRRWGLASF